MAEWTSREVSAENRKNHPEAVTMRRNAKIRAADFIKEGACLDSDTVFREFVERRRFGVNAFYRTGIGEMEHPGFAFAGGFRGKAFDGFGGDVGVDFFAFVAGEFGKGDFASNRHERSDFFVYAAEKTVVLRLEVIVNFQMDEVGFSGAPLD